MDSGTKERSAFFHQAFIPLCKLPPKPTSLSSGRKPSIAISDRSTIVARLAAQLTLAKIDIEYIAPWNRWLQRAVSGNREINPADRAVSTDLYKTVINWKAICC